MDTHFIQFRNNTGKVIEVRVPACLEGAQIVSVTHLDSQPFLLLNPGNENFVYVRMPSDYEETESVWWSFAGYRRA